MPSALCKPSVPTKVTSPQRERLTVWHHRSRRSCIQGPHSRARCDYPPKTRESGEFLALCVLGLAIAVFAWGVRYKTSLYNSASAQSPHMIAAKLLSNRERPADTRNQGRACDYARPSLFFASLHAFCQYLLLDPKRQSRWTLQRAQNSQRRPIPIATPQKFFRPPPSHRK